MNEINKQLVNDEEYIKKQNITVDQMDTKLKRVSLFSWVSVWLGLGVALIGTYYLWYVSKLDCYGNNLISVVGTIWSLSSVLFIYSAFIGQKQQILLQQIELRYTRIEMQATREELTGQKMEMEKQNEINLNQQFEASFFQMISIFNEIVKSIDIRKYTDKTAVTAVGRDCFPLFMRKLRSELNRSNGNKSIQVIQDAYYIMYNEYENDLGHYFRYLYHMVKFVHLSKVKDKNRFIGLIRAQLSANELALLVYNCISDHGYEKFRPLVNKYKLLKNLNNSLLSEPTDIKFLE